MNPAVADCACPDSNTPGPGACPHCRWRREQLSAFIAAHPGIGRDLDLTLAENGVPGSPPLVRQEAPDCGTYEDVVAAYGPIAF